MTKQLKKLFLLLTLIYLTGCATPMQRVQQQPEKDQLTLGKVQQTLKKGMKQADVAVALGSPNLVTRDSAGLETWIYDKLRTEISTAAASDSGSLLGGGVIGSGILGGSASASNSAATAVRSQKTLTVVLKFKNQTLVDYAFNSTSF
jgi:outer membrane protein assembly factor BamE (lipoprotein component of BamABCDE complex)